MSVTIFAPVLSCAVNLAAYSLVLRVYEMFGIEPGCKWRASGGRKPMLEKYPELNAVFLEILQEHNAGDPMNERVKWINLSCAQISNLLSGKGFKVSRNIVRQL